MEIIKKITDKQILGSDGISIKNPKISARAILFDNHKKIALMNVRKLAYSFPGGGVKEYETILDALRRELREETGCDIEVLREIGVIEENRFQHDFTQLSYYYLGRVIGEKRLPQLTEKEKRDEYNVTWLSIEECINILSNQIPINYQFEFIKQRDIEVINYITNDQNMIYSLFKEEWE